jgi:hypothetical protein
LGGGLGSFNNIKYANNLSVPSEEKRAKNGLLKGASLNKRASLPSIVG